MRDQRLSGTEKIDALLTHAKLIHYDKRNLQGLCKVCSSDE